MNRQQSAHRSRPIAQRDERRPEFDQARLATQTYLSVDEAMAYLRRFPTKAAFYIWIARHRVPKCRAGGLLFLRRDLDAVVQGHGKAQSVPLRVVHATQRTREGR